MDVKSSVEHIRCLLDNSKKPILFFDSDCDGGMSYFQLKQVWKNLEGYPINKSKSNQISCAEKIEADHDLVLFFDTPLIFEEVFEYAEGKKIVWVDHHPGNDLKLAKKYDVFHFNPVELDIRDSRPSCFWAYEIANSYDNLFRVAVGSVSDFYLLDVLKDFYEKKSEEFRVVFGLSDEKREELFSFLEKYDFKDESVRDKRADWILYLTYETRVGVFKQLFDFIYKMQVGVDRSLRMLSKMTPLEIVGEVGAGKGFLFEDFASFSSKQKKHIKKAIEKNKTQEFVYYEHKGKTSYNRQISEELSFRLKGSKCLECVFFKKGSDSVGISFRGRLGFVVNDIIELALEGLKGKGGGHPFAGGVHMSLEDFEIFQKRVNELVEKRLNGNF